MTKTPDTVVGILDPYVNRFELWGQEGRAYETGNPVPAVGMAASYSVQLAAPTDAKPVFLQVQDGRITNVMALQPLTGKSVFDGRGRYLGRGGQPLEPVSIQPPELPPDMLTAVRQMKEGATPVEVAPPPSQEKSVTQLVDELRSTTERIVERLPPEEPLTHRFHLRPDFEVKMKLPADLTKAEADRLALFVVSLPFEDEDEDDEY